MRDNGFKSIYRFESFTPPDGLNKCFNAYKYCIENKIPIILVLIGKHGSGKKLLIIAFFKKYWKKKY